MDKSPLICDVNEWHSWAAEQVAASDRLSFRGHEPERYPCVCVYDTYGRSDSATDLMYVGFVYADDFARKFRVSYVQGNGYRCGCCRRTHKVTRDFHTEVEAKAFIAELERMQRNPTEEEKQQDDDDVCDFKLTRIIDEDAV